MIAPAFLIPLKRIGYLTLIMAGSHLLAGCSKDPESAGKKLADTFCDSVEKQDASQYEGQEKLADEITAGKIKNRPQFNARQKELMKDTMVMDSTNGAKLKALNTQAEVDFPKEEDRTTLRNTFKARAEQCEQELAVKNKDRKDLQLTQLVAKLPFN